MQMPFVCLARRKGRAALFSRDRAIDRWRERGETAEARGGSGRAELTVGAREAAKVARGRSARKECERGEGGEEQKERGRAGGKSEYLIYEYVWGGSSSAEKLAASGRPGMPKPL